MYVVVSSSPRKRGSDTRDWKQEPCVIGSGLEDRSSRVVMLSKRAVTTP